MADTFSRKKRSWIMSRIKGRDTKPEIIIRTIIKHKRLSFRENDKNLPGSPDIVLNNRKKIIFIHGCFWHGHKLCQRSRRPMTNRVFWNKKIDGNIQRDLKTGRKLRRMGWNVIVLWECQIRKSTTRVKDRIDQFLKQKGRV